MAILFVGAEREALVQGASGTYLEDTKAGYYNSSFARTTARVNANSPAGYTCPLSATSGEVWLHLVKRYAGPTASANGPTFLFRDASANVIAKVVTNGSLWELQYWDGAAFVTVGSGYTHTSNLMTVDVHILKGTGTAEAAWYIDGVEVDSATGLTIAAFGNVAEVVLESGASTSSENYYSEVVVTDGASTIGWNLKTVPPTADGTDTDGTGTYADVDEVNRNDSDYLSFDTAAQKHSFDHTTLALVNFVKAVGVACSAMRVDGTGPQQIRPYVIVGATRYYGDTFPLSVSFENYEYVWDVSPDTGVDWTTDEVNAATFEMGWEAVA